jgi:hypothetical protein
MFIPSEIFGVNLVRNRPDGELHAERNFQLCRAIDMTSLSVVLDDMVKTGHLSPRLADAFKAQAGGLLAVMCSENNRSFIGSNDQSTIDTPRQFGVLGKRSNG